MRQEQGDAKELGMRAGWTEVGARLREIGETEGSEEMREGREKSGGTKREG